MKSVENMGLFEKTAIIFTSDHGFYFGEHGGLFGKMTTGKSADGRLRPYGDKESTLTYSPLFEELVHIPLLIQAPGLTPSVYEGLSSAVDVMPTVLDLLGMDVPDFVEGRSLAPGMRDGSARGRDFVISSIPFANPGDPVHSVDNLPRPLTSYPVTTVTSGEWSLLYSPEENATELYYLPTDPAQNLNAIGSNEIIAREMHQLLVRFMKETQVPERLLAPRLELRI